MTDKDHLLEAFLAGFRHSGEGYNGEYTRPPAPNPWDEDIKDHDWFRQEFEAWLEEWEE